MPKFPLIGPSYSSQSVNADCQQTMNLYPELIESNMGNNNIVLYPSPGTKLFVDLINIEELLAKAASTASGPCAPTELAWSNPSNVTLDTPGTYASVTLNSGGVVPSPAPNSGLGTGLPGMAITTNGPPATAFIGTLTPSADIQIGDIMLFAIQLNNFSVTPGNPEITAFTDQFGNNWQPIIPTQFLLNSIISGRAFTYRIFSAVSTTHIVMATPFSVNLTLSMSIPGGNIDWRMNFCNLTNVASLDKSSVLVLNSGGTGTNNSGTPITTAQSELIFSAIYSVISSTNSPLLSIARTSDSTEEMAAIFNGTNYLSPAGTYSPTWKALAGSGQPSDTAIVYLSYIPLGVTGEPCSNALVANNFGLTIPVDRTILGVAIEVGGHQTDVNLDVLLNVQLRLPDTTLSPITLNARLPLADGVITFGSDTQTWGLGLTPTIVNDPAFAAFISAQAHGGEFVTFDLYSVKAKVWYA